MPWSACKRSFDCGEGAGEASELSHDNSSLVFSKTLKNRDEWANEGQIIFTKKLQKQRKKLRRTSRLDSKLSQAREANL